MGIVRLWTDTGNHNFNVPNDELDHLWDAYWTTAEGPLVKADKTITMQGVGTGKQDFIVTAMNAGWESAGRDNATHAAQPKARMSALCG